METTTYTPPRHRVNMRIVLFIAIIAAPFAWFGYLFVNESFHHGVEHFRDYDKVNLKALGNFQFDPSNGTVKDVPPEWRALDGKRVLLQGFMWDGQGAGSQVKRFQFVWNVQKCCFNGPPLVQERVYARAAKGKSIPYINDFAQIVGTLHVKVIKSKDGNIAAVYTMDVDKAEPVS
ncbi:MAG TPA: DUF3299 domain-containing protein [Tepidisphaeraceae bacterium]|nr:DUF3299 domain-containing protein [Tepidisphaeraceae bacterium]